MTGRRYPANVNIPENGEGPFAINNKGQLQVGMAPTALVGPNAPGAGGTNTGISSVPLAGYANPKYIGGANANDATGFDITDCAAVAFAVANGPTFSFIVEQTLDPAGIADWFGVGVKDANNGQSAPASTVTSTGFRWVEAIGTRMRIRVTALTVANLDVRIGKLDYIPDMSSGQIVVLSPISEDGAASGNSALGIALEARNTQKTAMSATGDVVRAQGTMDGKQIVKPYSVPEQDWQAAVLIANVATDLTLKAAAGAGIRNYLTSLDISHESLAAGSALEIRDGAAGTILWRGYAAAGGSEGRQIQFPTPLKGTANTALVIRTFTAVAGNLFANAQGYSSTV